MNLRVKHLAALIVLSALVFLLAVLTGQAGPEPPPPRSASPRVLQAVVAPDHEVRTSAAPCVAGDCSSATAVTCNSLLRGDRNDDTNQWSTYNCMNPAIFASLPYSEALYTLSIPETGLDFSLAIPNVESRTVGSNVVFMNAFGAVLDSCDSGQCIASSHVKDLAIYQHAIVPDAPVKTYNLVVDSDNMSGSFDAIIACGQHATGWCSAAGVVSATLPCGTYTVHGDTNSAKGRDEITYYDINYAYDGPEVTYKIVLTESRYLSLTLHYAGNPAMDYFNYMSFFLMDETCNQRDWLWFGGVAGEPSAPSVSGHQGWLAPGTYYLVVDGMHMPTQGDKFALDVICQAPAVSRSYLPIVLRNLSP
jgi:hypothetical protein